jgi:hypothetical protein
MNLLIITYNCQNNGRTINHNDTLYIFNLPIRKIKDKKYVDFIPEQKIKEYILSSIKKYSSRFTHILIIDNNEDFTLEPESVLKFKKNMSENWILSGHINKAEYDIPDNNLTAEHFDINKLFVNCSNLSEEDIELMKSSVEKHVIFPHLSKIIHKKYDLCYENTNMGIIKNNRKNILI